MPAIKPQRRVRITAASLAAALVRQRGSIDSANAIHLGIPLKQVNTLMHYREKGGRFYKKEDLLKLYGLDPVIAHQLIPFIELTSSESKWGSYTNSDKGNNFKSNYDDAHKYKTKNYKENNLKIFFFPLRILRVINYKVCFHQTSYLILFLRLNDLRNLKVLKKLSNILVLR